MVPSFGVCPFNLGVPKDAAAAVVVVVVRGPFRPGVTELADFAPDRTGVVNLPLTGVFLDEEEESFPVEESEDCLLLMAKGEYRGSFLRRSKKGLETLALSFSSELAREDVRSSNVLLLLLRLLEGVES